MNTLRYIVSPLFLTLILAGACCGEETEAAANQLTQEKKFNSSRGGGVGIQANGNLYLMGGIRGGAIAGQDTSTDTVGTGGPPIDGAELNNWTALGSGAIQVRRGHAGIAEESAFFFVAGGVVDLSTTPMTLTTSVEQNTR